LYGYVLGDLVSGVDALGLFLDTITDVGFVIYDVYITQIAKKRKLKRGGKL